MNKKRTPLFTLAALMIFSGLSLMGCDPSTNGGDPGQSNVTLQFATTAQNTPAKASSKALVDDTLRIEGSNGTLTITDIRFIVEDFELERADTECEDLEGVEEDACEEFEADPMFVDLPLEGDTLGLNTTPIEAGLYEELEFEVDDLELDEEDAEEQDVKQQLINEVRNEFPDWPDSVSMVVIGTFNPTNGNATDFMTYIEAEIEIELEFNPPLEISDDTIDQLVRVNIDPAAWFLNSDGTVWDLSEYDFNTTGQTLEFEAEIENGFESIEHEDDHEDDEGESEND